MSIHQNRNASFPSWKAFSFQCLDALAPLAWCLIVERISGELKVLHGKQVHAAADMVVDGCWSGELTASDLLSADVCAATGVVLVDGDLWLCTPTNTVGRLHSIQAPGRLVISNSMALACAVAGARLKRHYHFYKDDLCSITEGLHKCTRSLPLADGLSLRLHYHCNVRVDSQLQLQEQPKNCPRIGTRFIEYRTMLEARLKALLANAQDVRRGTRLKPISTLSRGYDSVACTILARSAGCQEVLCFHDPSADEPHADDGTELAARLDLQSHLVSRLAYREMADEPVFLATGTGGEDAFFAPYASLLRHRVLVSGFHGDKVWDRHTTYLSSDIVRGDPSGADLEEFRLRVGFFHVPLPFVGCQDVRAVHAISNHEEMTAWRVPGNYDRPICRRLGEDAALPRGDFGTRKRVMSRAFNESSQIGEYFGATSLGRFSSYLGEHPVRATWSHRAQHQISRGLLNSERILGRHSFRLGQLAGRPAAMLSRFEDAFDAKRAIFPWAFEVVLREYASALKTAEGYARLP